MDTIINNDATNTLDISLTVTMRTAATNVSGEIFDRVAHYLQSWSPLWSLGVERGPKHLAMHPQGVYKIGLARTYTDANGKSCA